MPQPTPPARQLAFSLHDVARLLKTVADQRARSMNMTRAQWAVLARIEQAQGLKQAELAELLEIAPITLTRIVDRLCANGLVERRADARDRRAKRLFLTDQAKPVVERLGRLGAELMRDVLAGMDQRTFDAMLAGLELMKTNLREPGRPAEAAA
jgi:MarR family transcriptional regulator for hemolysin